MLKSILFEGLGKSIGQNSIYYTGVTYVLYALGFFYAVINISKERNS